MIKNLAIVQARMGSSRLPGKVLLSLGGKLVIDCVYDQILKCKNIDEIIIATSIDQNNIPLLAHCTAKGYRVFVGSEDDVLDRFYQVAKLIRPHNIVRITADCPLIDPKIIDKTICRFIETNVDYCNNLDGGFQFPDGLDIEIFSFQSLERSWLEARKMSEREHVTPYIRNNNIFSKSYLSADKDYSSVRITLDEERDYLVIQNIIKVLREYNMFDFCLDDIMDIWNCYPEIRNQNQDIQRNEGYFKSIKND